MKKFNFKLSIVLEVRKNQENEALRVLANAQNVYQREIERKASLMSQLQNALQRREELASTPTTITSFQLEQNNIICAKQRILQAEQAIFRATKELEKARRNYINARRQSSIMETLRDREHRKYRQEVSKKEQKAMDELTVMRSQMKEEAL
jgi:flagellar export protein FliJ